MFSKTLQLEKTVGQWFSGICVGNAPCHAQSDALPRIVSSHGGSSVVAWRTEVACVGAVAL